MPASAKELKLRNAALTIRLGYLPHVPEDQLTSWIEQLELVLQWGATWPPVTDEQVDFDDVDLYRKLEDDGFPQLVALQRQAGKGKAGRRAILAVLVLLELQKRNGGEAMEASTLLRHHARIAGLTDEANTAKIRKQETMKENNEPRLIRSRARAQKLIRQAKTLKAAHHPRPEIVRLVAKAHNLSEARARTILRENLPGFFPRQK